MSLPAPPPLKKSRHLKRALWEAHLATLPLDQHPITFPSLEPILYDQDITKKTGFRCRTCLRFSRCCLSPQQMLQCMAYFLWHPQVSTNPSRVEDTRFLERLPLTEDALDPLSVQQLLGLYFFQHVSLATLVDITPRGLRSRLLEIQHETCHPSPYLLRVE